MWALSESQQPSNYMVTKYATHYKKIIIMFFKVKFINY